MSVFNYEKDTDGIVTITMDMTGPVNSMNDEFLPALSAAVERLTQESGLIGVIFASAKKTFFAGGNLHSLLAAEPGMEQKFFEGIEAVKREFRTLELMPVPIVAAINGAALGGGGGGFARGIWTHRGARSKPPRTTALARLTRSCAALTRPQSQHRPCSQTSSSCGP